MLATALAAVVLAASPGQIRAYEGGPNAMLLWPAGAPGAVGSEASDRPSITRLDPPKGKSNGAAMVICPGGGYAFLASHEAEPVGEWLNTLGVTAFVLKYRIAPRYKHPAPLHDAQRAIRTIRYNAKAWGIDPNRIGILGFSAGGHLTSTAVTHFDPGNPSAEDPIDRVSSRPDLGVLIYPVISFVGPAAHAGSRRNLLGENPPAELVEKLSSEKQVTARTPPCFLMHTADDAVSVENALLFAEALRKNRVPFELHVYEHGVHGYGLAQNDPILRTWTNRCADWLRVRNFIKSE